MKYEIIGDSFPVVICNLQSGEAMKSESGSMVWMDPCMEMSTNAGGGLGGMFSRAITGESIFQNIYTAKANGKIAFGSSFPGSIKAVEITPGKEIIVQKCAFLAGEMGVNLTTHINQKLGTGLFGGEGFVMQKLSGQGIAFLEVDGSFAEYELAPGQQLIVDTGNVLGFESSVQLNIQRVKGAKNVLFGGEGLFNTTLTGPGKVWLQTMPACGLAMSIYPYLPKEHNN